MKQSWIVACVFVLVSLSIPAAGRVGDIGGPELPVGREAGFEVFLPKETVMFVSVRDVPSLLDKLKQLPLGKVVCGEGFLERLGPPEFFGEAKRFYETYAKPIGAILRGEVALGIVEFDLLAGVPAAIVVLVDVAGKEDALATYLEEKFFPWLDANEGLGRREVTVAGAPFTAIVDAVSEERTAALGVRNRVCVGIPHWFEFEPIVKALGERPRDNLGTNPWFAKVEQALPGADIIEYVNVGAIDRQMRKHLIDEEGVGEDYQASWGVFHAISGFECVEAAGMGMTFSPGEEGTTICAFGSGFHGGVAGVLNRAAPLKSLRYVSDDASFYLALSLGSLSQVYKDSAATVAKWAEALGDPDQLAAFHETIALLDQCLERGLGDEVLPAFGGEIAVAAWIPGGLDVPPGALMIEAKDKKVVGEIVAHLLKTLEEAGGELSFEKKTYEGVEITSVDGVPQVIPAVALVGDFLVVATNASVIEDMIDTLADGPRLDQADGYKRYVASMPGDAAITLYVDAKRIFEFGWPFAVAMMGPPPEAAKGTLKAVGEIGEALSPFGMKVLGDERGITITSRSANGGLGTASFLGGLAAFPIMLHAAVAPHPDGGAVGFEPQVIEHHEVDVREEEI